MRSHYFPFRKQKKKKLEYMVTIKCYFKAMRCEYSTKPIQLNSFYLPIVYFCSCFVFAQNFFDEVLHKIETLEPFPDKWKYMNCRNIKTKFYSLKCNTWLSMQINVYKNVCRNDQSICSRHAIPIEYIVKLINVSNPFDWIRVISVIFTVILFLFSFFYYVFGSFFRLLIHKIEIVQFIEWK